MCPRANNRKIGSRDIIYADDFIVSLLFIILTSGGLLRRRIRIPPITGVCDRKTKAITAAIHNFLFIFVHLFKLKGTDGICETIATFYGLSFLRAVLLQSRLGHRGDVKISINLMLMKQST